MIFHVSLRCEGLPAQFALVRLFLSVDPDMNDEVGSLGESFVTPGVRTPERLRPLV